MHSGTSVAGIIFWQILAMYFCMSSVGGNIGGVHVIK